MVLASHTLLDALPVAIVMGLAAGCCRPWWARAASGFRAEQAGLVIRRGPLTSELVAWPDVLALETWRFAWDTDYAVVHYRSASGPQVAVCWEKRRREELLAFVTASAKHARRHEADAEPAAQLASLRDRPIWSGLARELAMNVALTCAAGAFVGRLGEAAVLALVVGGSSGLLASARFDFRVVRFVHRDGLWQRVAEDGTLETPRVLPKKLKSWLTQLALADSQNEP